MENIKINYLVSGINDAQSLITFMDTKAAFIMTIIAAYMIKTYSMVDVIIKNYSHIYIYNWILILIFMSCLILCVIVIIRIIKPTNNPQSNVTFNGESLPKLKFFLDGMEYSDYKWLSIFMNRKADKLSASFPEYKKTLSETNEQDIIDSLIFELQKISYIRNIKIKRFYSLLSLFIFTSVVFLIFIVLIQQNISY